MQYVKKTQYYGHFSKTVQNNFIEFKSEKHFGSCKHDLLEKYQKHKILDRIEDMDGKNQ